MNTSKIIAIALVAILSLSLLPSCANITPATGSSLVRLTVGVGLTPVLSKNRKYIPVAEALAAGIDVAIGSSTTITLSGINFYVKGICEKEKVPEEDIIIFTGLADTIYNTYVEQYKVATISTADPKVLLYVAAFKNGVNDAVLNVKSNTK